MRILIVKLSSIGDIVHTLPVLAAVRRAFPQAEVSWAVEKRSAEILRGNELIDNLIEVDTRALRGGKVIKNFLPEAGRQLRELRKHDFDIALDFQGLLKSALIAKLSGAKKRYGFSKPHLREPASRFLLTETFDAPAQISIYRKNLSLAAQTLNIEVPTENFEFPIFTNDEQKLEAEKIIEQTGENFVILNPSGGWVTKLWHAENYSRLADKLWEENGFASVVTTAPNERNLAEKICEKSVTGKVFLAQPSLKGLYELAKHAQIYVGGDTGPTFLAIAANAPVVGIYGPTEYWRNGSPNPDDIAVERLDIPCRVNCHRRACANWICLDIPVETVYQAVLKRLESKVQSPKSKV